MSNYPLFQEVIKIGTRGSLLAVTQATQTMNQLAELTGNRYELVLIKTEGDIKTDKPLWQLEGDNFFTKELDSALESGAVDMVIHSYKDLGSIRPPFCELAAVTKREFAQDILLIKRETISKLAAIEEFIVGTSSPRRIVNLENHLADFINEGMKVTTKMLRGNVNTRVEKLVRGDYHAICLAFPGLERLAKNDDSRKVLENLLVDVTFMILPQSQFPSAASQGALAIEISKDHTRAAELRKNIKSVHDELSAKETKLERELFNSYGGGCHLAVGINAKKKNEFTVINERGRSYQNETVFKTTLVGGKPLPKVTVKNIFIGLPKNKIADLLKSRSEIVADELIKKTPIQDLDVKINGNLVVSSTYSANAIIKLKQNRNQTVWAAGTQTTKLLAKQGIWVNGQSDSIGDSDLVSFKNSKLLPIMEPAINNKEWFFLTNSDSTPSFGKLITAYRREILQVSKKFEEEITKCTHFYWTSYNQYETYLEKFGASNFEGKIHACGIGKSWDQFAKKSVRVYPFISQKDFLNSLENS